ncbi:unnamed protein product, partial [Amoebophrya sp. A120]
EQRSIDKDVVLADESEISGTDKVRQLFGIKLDWRKFPIVLVTEVDEKTPDGSDNSRATKGGIVVGDMLVLINGERITTVAQLRIDPATEKKNAHPDSVLISMVAKRVKAEKATICSWLFLRKKYQCQLRQISYKPGTDGEFGITRFLDNSCEISEVSDTSSEQNWAKKNEVKVGDSVLFFDADFLLKRPEKLSLPATTAKNSVEVLVFRKMPGFDKRLNESNVARPLSPTWEQLIQRFTSKWEVGTGTSTGGGNAAASASFAGNKPAITSSLAASASSSSSVVPSSLKRVCNRSAPPSTQFLYAILAASIKADKYADFGMSGW